MKLILFILPKLGLLSLTVFFTILLLQQPPLSASGRTLSYIKTTIMPKMELDTNSLKLIDSTYRAYIELRNNNEVVEKRLLFVEKQQQQLLKK